MAAGNFFTKLARWFRRGTRAANRHRRVKVESLESRRVLTSSVEVWAAGVYEGDSGSSYLEFQVNLLAPITEPLMVDYHTVDGDPFWLWPAEAGSDYAATSGTLLFEPGGLTSQFVLVEVFGDTRWEFGQHEAMTLFAVPSDGSGPSEAGGLIAADDAVPQLSISDAAIEEGPSGEFSFAEFTITRAGASGDEIILAYETVYGTADEFDLQYTGEFITLEAGETSRVVSIPIYGDITGSPDRLNGNYFLSLGTTVFDDGENDSQSGGPGSNWQM